VPDGIEDEEVLFRTDILPTGFQAAVNAEIQSGTSVAIFGAGPMVPPRTPRPVADARLHWQRLLRAQHLLRHRPDPRLDARLELPTIQQDLHGEVTDACNLACRVCYADSKGDRVLSLEAFRKHIGALLAQKGSLDSVQLIGGEPTIHPQFWDMLADLHAKPRISKVYFATNDIAVEKPGAAERLLAFRDKVLVLLHFDGHAASTARRFGRPTRSASARGCCSGSTGSTFPCSSPWRWCAE